MQDRFDPASMTPEERTREVASIRALQDMTVPGLREQYREVFGKETRSRHPVGPP